MVMDRPDWFTAIATLLALGGGAYMSTFTRNVIRSFGISLMALGIAGLIFWFGYYRNAETDGQNAGNSVTGSTNSNVISVPGNNNTVTVTPTQTPPDGSREHPVPSKADCPPGTINFYYENISISNGGAGFTAGPHSCFIGNLSVHNSKDGFNSK